MLIRVGKAVASRVLRKLRGPSLADAQAYTGTDEVSGRLQLELLKLENCVSTSRVLEVGCGCLSAGLPVIEFLEPHRYVGIDPNQWLREAALREPRARRIVAQKGARFMSVTDFDASGLAVQFDFALSHSILSHCAHWQLPLFLANVSKTLAPRGKIVSSIRLAEGNRYGSPGTPDQQDSRDQEWRYPGADDPLGVSWFGWPTVSREAATVGLTARHVPEYTELFTRTRPKECHDWVVFTRS